MDISVLQSARYKYQPKLPAILAKKNANLELSLSGKTESVDNQSELREMFPSTYGLPVVQIIEGKTENNFAQKNVGVILSGGQAPGGHNVIAGIFDGLLKLNNKSKLFGFLGGPSGLTDDKVTEITADYLDVYRNTGGFDIIGSGRTKLETEEQFKKCIEVCHKRDINAVVVIGGDDSNTNAAVLAEYFRKNNADIQVIGVPKTIDGDLKNEHIETSFGFDTATKTYSELIGNIERDANSAKKYWHFIKLMGRSASHIALECALQTQPNICIISEEVAEKRLTLTEVVEDIADAVVKRSNEGLNFGVVLVPEGLIEFIPEMKLLISELNDILAHNQDYFSTLTGFGDQSAWINKKLSKDSSYAFSSLPGNIQRQLLMDRDPHGNVQVSRIETEKLLIEMTEARLRELASQKVYKGSFSYQAHFFGYEGRCAFPSNFDADYCYSLGYTASVLIYNNLSGYMSSVKNLSRNSENWIAGGLPITMMMNLEQRHGALKPVIKKALVELQGKPFKFFAARRDTWRIKTSFTFPGAIQYFGPDEVCNMPSKTILLEQGE